VCVVGCRKARRPETWLAVKKGFQLLNVWRLLVLGLIDVARDPLDFDVGGIKKVPEVPLNLPSQLGRSDPLQTEDDPEQQSR
jgi:hypothetical protein